MAPLKVTLHVYDLKVNLESAFFDLDNSWEIDDGSTYEGGSRHGLIARCSSISALQQFVVRHLGHGLSLAVRATNRLGMAAGWGGLLHTGVSVDWGSSGSGDATCNSAVEFGFGACAGTGSGVYECKPGCNLQFHHACTISLGETPLAKAQVRAVVAELAAAWPGHRYHLLHRNCHHFTTALCEALQVKPPPPWCNRLAHVGANVAGAAVQTRADLYGLLGGGEDVVGDCVSTGNNHRLSKSHHSRETEGRCSSGRENDSGALSPPPLATCRRLVFAAAIVSRLLTCCGLLVADWFLPEALVASADAKTFGTVTKYPCSSSAFFPQDNSGGDNCTSGARSGGAVVSEETSGAMRWLQGGARWDAAHFLSVARDGYGCSGFGHDSRDNTLSDTSCNYSGTYDERSFAFFPLYPALVRVVAYGLHSASTFAAAPFTSTIVVVGQGDWTFVVSGLLVSNSCFVAAALVLLELGFVVLGRPTTSVKAANRKDTAAAAAAAEHGQRLASVGALAFCISPAGPFFSAAYSESLFSFLTFSGLLLLSSGSSSIHDDNNSSIRNTWYYSPWVATVLLTAAAGARSNGVLGVGFVAADSWKRACAVADTEAAGELIVAKVEAASKLQSSTPDPSEVPSMPLSLIQHKQTSESTLHRSSRSKSKKWALCFALQLAWRAPGLCLRCTAVVLPSLLHDLGTAASLCAAAYKDNLVTNGTCATGFCPEAEATADKSPFFPRVPPPVNFCGNAPSPPPPSLPPSSLLSLWAPALSHACGVKKLEEEKRAAPGAIALDVTSTGGSPVKVVEGQERAQASKGTALRVLNTAGVPAAQRWLIGTLESLKELLTWWTGALKWWWKAGMPSGYRHLQRSHWGVGLFRYWQLKQLPNFVLAAPMLLFTTAGLGFCILPWWRCSLRAWQWCWSAPYSQHPLDGLFSRLQHMHHPLRRMELWPYYAHWFILAVTVFAVANVQVVTRLVGAACPIFYWAIGEALVGECASPLLGNKDGDVDDDNGKNGSSTADACNGSAGTNGSKCLKTKDASNKDAGTDSDNEYLGHLTMIRGGREGSRENWSIGSAKHSKHASGINQVPIGKQGNESRSPRPPKMPQLKFWVLAWIITFNVAGTFLHSNGLPWT